MTTTTTSSTVVCNLTTQDLQRWQEWCIKELQPKLIPLSEVQQSGEYLVISSKYKPTFGDVGGCWLNTITVDKVTKLKVGTKYRSSIEGWVVPSELIDAFHQCRDASIAHRDLRREAIDLVSRLPRNGYERVCALTPEKMQALINIFEG